MPQAKIEKLVIFQVIFNVEGGYSELGTVVYLQHLGESKPPTDFSEMICQNCMSKHDFLWAYTASSKGKHKVKSSR